MIKFFPELPTCTHLLEAASPSWPSPLALWPVRPTTEGRGEHSAPGEEAWERWVPCTSWEQENEEFWDTGSTQSQVGKWLYDKAETTLNLVVLLYLPLKKLVRGIRQQ